MTKKTPLYEQHLAANAKMSDFAGWEMPLSYTSPIEEHKQVRNDAGMFDVSHMTVVDFKGSESRDFLRHLITNDVDKLTSDGKALYSCMLNENGGIVDDLIVYKICTDHYRMVINAATHDKDLAWINKNINDFDVELAEETNIAMLAIQGPHAIEKTQQVFTKEQQTATKDLESFQGVAVNNWWIARTGYTGEDGYEIILPATEATEFWNKLIEVGVKPCGLIARDSLRLEAGMRLYGSDMDETTTPLESGLGWAIAWEPKDRDFIGKEALIKQKAIGTTQKVVGLILEGRGVLRPHQKVILDDNNFGETTSGGFSPTLGVSIALARIPKITADKCFVEIREQQIPAKIVKPVFARNGKPVS